MTEWNDEQLEAANAAKNEMAGRDSSPEMTYLHSILVAATSDSLSEETVMAARATLAQHGGELAVKSMEKESHLNNVYDLIANLVATGVAGDRDLVAEAIERLTAAIEEKNKLTQQQPQSWAERNGKTSFGSDSDELTLHSR